ncbi:MAG: hypothetical protein ABH886_10235 [Candidatus Desantisbacteria bacterium]
MQHYQKWNSADHKLKIWLELCNLCYQLKLEGMRVNLGDERLAEKEVLNYMKNLREAHRLINQKIMARMYGGY